MTSASALAPLPRAVPLVLDDCDDLEDHADCRYQESPSGFVQIHHLLSLSDITYLTASNGIVQPFRTVKLETIQPAIQEDSANSAPLIEQRINHRHSPHRLTIGSARRPIYRQYAQLRVDHPDSPHDD
ncbi:hypothetical protein H7J71_25315 [Mycolicibacterium peregrinum]|uniref:hypothetical protein n=1 Tax=Mycolicibacterium peregrinum TaxID=43304 RepID=UPI0013747AB7|nr:hypothetical protein [Mycolicibacterium peregrinum]MCV7205328.1 hypothetical protein [Mycolicibacterium peregrinum]